MGFCQSSPWATANASSSRRSGAITAATASRSAINVPSPMNIFVTRKLPASVISSLETVGDVEVYAGDGTITAEELRAKVGGKHGLVTMLTEQVNAALLDAGKDLKVVANV